MADWAKIKKEYIKGGISYRDLAKKYQVSMRTLGDRAKAEGWVNLREQARDKAVTKMIETVADRNARIDTSIYDAAMLLLDAYCRSIQAASEAEIPPSMLKDYGAALKNIQAVLERPTELDIKEQVARIEKLRKDAKMDDESNEAIVVQMSGELEDYAK